MIKFYVCEEMQKLRDMLDKNNIPWEDVSDMWEGIEVWMCRTHFEYMDYFWSVIHGYGSYGGINPGSDKGGQLLEVASSAFSEPIGSCKAEEIWEMMQKIAHERSGNEETKE